MTTPSERLRTYRLETLHLKTKREMAKFLGVSEDVYAKAENGVRTPSKKLLEALFDKTGLGEEYWKYGINQNNPKNTELTATLNIIVMFLFLESILYLIRHILHQLVLLLYLM